MFLYVALAAVVLVAIVVALVLSGGDHSIFLTDPISAGLLAVSVLFTADYEGAAALWLERVALREYPPDLANAAFATARSSCKPSHTSTARR